MVPTKMSKLQVATGCKQAYLSRSSGLDAGSESSTHSILSRLQREHMLSWRSKLSHFTFSLLQVWQALPFRAARCFAGGFDSDELARLFLGIMRASECG